MNLPAGSIEQRRAERKRIDFTAVVTDTISGLPFGQLGNLSATGLMIIGTKSPRSEAIYQLRLPLSGTDATSIEVGVQEQWQEPIASRGQVWSGYRIVAIADADASRLEHWLALAD